MQKQQETNWCWVAAAASISLFLDKNSQTTQCELVTREFGCDCCGARSKTTQCNEAGSVARALRHAGISNKEITGKVSFSDVQAEIAMGYPVGVRVKWRLNGAHVLAISGWKTVSAYQHFYKVEDPLYNSDEIPIDELADFYQEEGEWSHTYLVRLAKP